MKGVLVSSWACSGNEGCPRGTKGHATGMKGVWFSAKSEVTGISGLYLAWACSGNEGCPLGHALAYIWLGHAPGMKVVLLGMLRERRGMLQE